MAPPAAWRSQIVPRPLEEGDTLKKLVEDDRSRLPFSNHGNRIDVQGWGRRVTTCGYGDLQEGPSENYWYTDEFGGTSAAAAVVAGVLACLQGFRRAKGLRPLTSRQARDLVRASGSEQTTGPHGAPLTHRIGRRPNLRDLIDET